MKNKKRLGFTLVELLIAIVILGIFTALAFPAIQKLQKENKNKKYETYENIIIDSAKLYVDSYKEDMFKTDKNITTSQCKIITHQDMKNSYLFKEYNGNKNVNCQIDGTKILIVKVGNQYQYQLNIKCKNARGDIVYSNENIVGTCDSNGNYIKDETPPSATVTVSSTACSKNPTATVKIKDNGGLKENTNFAYAWISEGATTPTESQKKYYSFTNSAGVKELTAIINLNKDTGVADGNYKLWIDTTNIKDIYENHKSETKTSSHIKLDTTAPSGLTVTLKKWSNNSESSRPTQSNYSSLNTYTAGGWSNRKIYTIASATDNCSNSDKLTYKYTTTGATTEESDKVGKARSIEKNGISYIKYQACDEAGNCSAYTNNYTVKVDTINPSCSILTTGTSGNNSWYKSNVALTLSVDDTLGEVASYDLTTSSSATYTNKTNQTQTQDTSGTTWYGYVKDKAGNTANCRVVIKKDTQAPTVPNIILKKWKDNDTRPTQSNYSSLSNYTTGDWSNKKIYSIASATDNYTQTNSLTYQHTTTGDTTNDTNKTGRARSIEAGGTSYIQYRACDEAGNCSNYTSNQEINIDKKVPTCTTAGTSKEWKKGTRKITYGCDDSQSGCKAGASVGTKVYPKTYSGEKAELPAYTIEDNAGNIKTCEKKDINVYLDNTAPVYGTKIRQCTAENGHYPFGFNVSDAHSGIDTSSEDDYFYYCYNVKSGWPAASCGTTCASGGLAANYNSAKSNKQLSGVSKGCTDHPKTNYIEAYFKICDKVGNCATMGSSNEPIKFDWRTC